MICRYHGIDCYNANENGYCKVSACNNANFVGNIHPIDKAFCIGEKLHGTHGRLIDIDRFIKEKRDFYCSNCEKSICKTCWVFLMIDEIDNAPTVLEATE